MRVYDSTRRRTAAERRRETIVSAAKDCFERDGWSGTTIRSIGSAAGVSPKTIEARFGTKARLLGTVVDFAIRGDLDATPMPRRAVVREMEEARDAAAFLHLHARHLREIDERSARIARVVEQAAPADPVVARLWRQMNHNRSVGVRWAAGTVASKPGLRAGLTVREIETAVWVALDWGTYRTLTEQAGLSAAEYEAWLSRYYASMLLADRPRVP